LKLGDEEKKSILDVLFLNSMERKLFEYSEFEKFLLLNEKKKNVIKYISNFRNKYEK
jgi:hypothetical protein